MSGPHCCGDVCCGPPVCTLPTHDLAFAYLEEAESTYLRFRNSELISDEAELMRGCLAALVSIARQTYDAAGEGSG